MTYVSFLDIEDNVICNYPHCEQKACFKYFTFDKANLAIYFYCRCKEHEREFDDNDSIEHPRLILKMIKSIKKEIFINSKIVKTIEEIELSLNKGE